MKNDLIKTIQKIITLLSQCDFEDKANWVRGKLEIIKHEANGSQKMNETLKELNNIIAGMGSFSDLSLTPKKEAGMTTDEASEIQWKLADDLGKHIRQFLK